MDYVYELNLYKKGANTKKDDFYFEPYCFPLVETMDLGGSIALPLYTLLEENPNFRFTRHHYARHGNQPWSKFIQEQIYPRTHIHRCKWRISRITHKHNMKYLFDPTCLLEIAKEYNFNNALDQEKLRNLWDNAYWIVALKEMEHKDTSDDS